MNRLPPQPLLREVLVPKPYKLLPLLFQPGVYDLFLYGLQVRSPLIQHSVCSPCYCPNISEFGAKQLGADPSKSLPAYQPLLPCEI